MTITTWGERKRRELVRKRGAENAAPRSFFVLLLRLLRLLPLLLMSRSRPSCASLRRYWRRNRLSKIQKKVPSKAPKSGKKRSIKTVRLPCRLVFSLLFFFSSLITPLSPPSPSSLRLPSSGTPTSRRTAQTSPAGSRPSASRPARPNRGSRRARTPTSRGWSRAPLRPMPSGPPGYPRPRSPGPAPCRARRRPLASRRGPTE